MATYGVTSNGFVLKRLPVILEEMQTQADNLMPGIDTSPDSVTGVMIDVNANPIADNWEVIQAVYKAAYPNSAEGLSLDDVGEITATPRLPAIASTVQEGFEGINGTIIANGTQIKSNAGDIFRTLIDAQLDNTKTVKVENLVSSVQNNFAYTILINGSSIVYTSDADATYSEITNGLVNAINLDTETLLVNATIIDADTGKFYIISNDGEASFEQQLGSNLSLTKFWTPIKVQALETGEIEADANTITTIVTPIAGLNSVNNFTDVTIGSEIESDIAYRERRFKEVRRLGGGSLEAIKARIQSEVDNVLQVKAFENETLITDGEGRPGKSIEILVEGGEDNAIANELWYVKGGGIETFGDVSVQITDSQGDLQLVKFSRPVKAYIWLNIEITTNELFPSNGIDLIKENCVELGRNNFTIGDLILIQEFYCPIYGVDGVLTVPTLQIAKTPNPGDIPVYQSTNLQLLSRESPIFGVERITVTVL